jgi:hypothetical protein
VQNEAEKASFHIDLRSRSLATAVVEAWTTTDIAKAKQLYTRCSKETLRVAGKAAVVNKKAKGTPAFKEAEKREMTAYLHWQAALLKPLSTNALDKQWAQESGRYAMALYDTVQQTTESVRREIASERLELTQETPCASRP